MKYTTEEFTQFNGGFEVFTDTIFKPSRPILYYRKHSDGQWHAEANSAHLNSTDSSGGPTNYMNRANVAGERFFFVWAGLDRQFFTGDDFSSLDSK